MITDKKRAPLVTLARRHGFTLVELLIVVTIIAVISSLALVVLRGAQEDAMIARTGSQMERINKILLTRLEAYQGRIIPIRLDDPNADPKDVSDTKRWALAELIFVEMPCTRDDLRDRSGEDFPKNPSGASISGVPVDVGTVSSGFPKPSMLQRLRAHFKMPLDGSSYGSDWTAENEGAECLYAVLASIRDVDDRLGTDFLHVNEIGDTDGDGMLEVLDAFGDPFNFFVGYFDPVAGTEKPVDPFAAAGTRPAIDQYYFRVTSPNLSNVDGTTKIP